MKQYLIVFFALSVSLPALRAEQLYVLLEDGCADRLRYEQAIATQARTDYYAYSFPLADGGRLTLETGREGTTIRSTIPIGYIGCNDPRLNGELVQRLDNPADQVFVLRPAPNNQYYVHEVVNASLVRRYAGLLTYTSPLTSFRMEEDNAIVGENIAYRNPSANVVFEGRDLGPCGGVYLFQQTDPEGTHPVSNYRVSPYLGLLERRLGSNGPANPGGVVVARSVNGVPIMNYLATNCHDIREGRRPGASLVLSIPEAATVPRPPNYTSPRPQPSVAPKAPIAIATPPTAPAGATTHTVRKNETLYALGRRYRTTPEALRRLNNLKDNTIYPGQVLQVAVTAYTPEPAPAVYAAGPRAATPTYARYVGKTHTVNAGETVATVALRSGYTQERFREINGLGPDDFLLIGQTVRTDHCDCPTTLGYPPAAATTTALPLTLPDTPINRPAATPPAPRAYGTPNVQQPRSPAPAPTSAPVTQPRRYGQSEPVLPTDPFAGVPLLSSPAPVASPAPVSNASVDQRLVHTVQYGESLYSIARRYDTTPAALRQLNGLQPSEVIVPFQKLYLN